MFRAFGRVLSAILLSATVTSAVYLRAEPGQRADAPSASLSTRALLDQYCVTCHNGRIKAGNLLLDALDVAHPTADAEVWEKVVRKLQVRAMPPVGRPRPSDADYDRLIASLESSLDGAAKAMPNPGRSAIHRLNRSEYANVVRDLLALNVDVTAMLPSDDAGYGFDNVADALTVSPGLLERYLLAAKKISRLAVGDPTLRPAVAAYKVPFSLKQDERLSEELPFGSRGGIAVRHYFPLDGEYVIKIRMQRNSLDIGGEIRGLDVPNQIDVRLDGTRVHRFTLGGDRSYRVRTYKDTEDAGLEVRFTAKSGERVVGVTFQKDSWDVEGVGMSRLPVTSSGYASAWKTDQAYGKIEMGVDSIEITGPFAGQMPADSPSRRQIFTCRPVSSKEEEPCARAILSRLAHRAYRRPVTDTDIATLLTFYKSGRRSAGNFEAGIQSALVRMLADPEFLFRIERDPAGIPPGTAYRIGDLELASRLSFFVWSSIPDDSLLELAERGQLKKPDVLERQVLRMLRDERSKALVDNFFGQWLYVRNVAAVKPDSKAFPNFDENLREAFRQETMMFLESQIKENRPITELLTAKYTFVNERLAQHYGIPNVNGSHFRRVSLEASARAGILGQGSFLMVTSYANRTSPVQRGKWLLENLLGTPPPPPPADVPPLESTEIHGSLRQRMEQHRKNPVCATCHAQMDPLGFAFENFDGIGQWRTSDAATPIDASGAWVDGTAFKNPEMFREVLLSHRDAVRGTLTERLLTYALGRGVEYYDMPAVRAILRDTSTGGDTWSALLMSIARSLPFQMRRSES